MNITYTDDKGEQVVFFDHQIDIPDYVRGFDAQKPFLNIKAEDVSMLSMFGKPASKAVTLERYKMFLKMDFRNFVHSSYAEAIRASLSMEGNVRNYANLKNVGEEAIDSILCVVQECYKNLVSSLLNPNDYHLLYMRVCGALHKKWNKEKTEWLAPFYMYKGDAYIKIGALTLEDKDFLVSLISVMNAQNEKYRKEIYSVMLILTYVYELSAHPGICDGVQLQECVNGRMEKDCFQSFSLLDAKSPLTAEELAVLNGPNLSDEERKIVMSHLNRFKDRVNVDAELSSYVTPYHKFRLDLLTPQQCVEVFFKRLDRLKAENPYPEDTPIEDVSTPKCYLAFLAENISGELIDWKKDNPLVNGLMYLIYIKQGQNIVYIAKEVTVMNYVIEHMADAIDATDDEALLNETIEKALDFIDVIFSEEFLGKANSADSLKSKFRVILRDSELRKKITQISPNKFNGGFNLVLVYNIIGLLMNQGLIKGRISKIDSDIATANRQFSSKGKLLERRKYISCWNIEDESELTRKNIDKIVATYL